MRQLFWRSTAEPMIQPISAPVSSCRPLPPKGEPNAPPADTSPAGEGGPSPQSDDSKDKTLPQHAGTIGVILSSLGYLASTPRLAKEIPLLNLGVGVVETGNTIHQLIHKDHAAATAHASNAACCLGTFAEDVGRIVSIADPAGHPLLTGTAVGLGLAGGVLGVVTGVTELRKGFKALEATGSNRLLHMGMFDTISGLSTTTGIALCAANVAPTVGAGLLVGATVCDLASIAVEYSDMVSDRKRNIDLSLPPT